MRPLIRAIDSSPLKDKFNLSQQITYRYYVGRKAMFDSDYVLGQYRILIDTMLDISLLFFTCR